MKLDHCNRRKDKTMGYPTRLDLCDGKYSVIYDLETGQSECLRYGEKWRELCGDKMVLAMFDRIVELEEGIHEIERLRGVLADIINPIGAMQRDLEDGYQLDGAMAVAMANDPEHYKRIARDALTPNAISKHKTVHNTQRRQKDT